MWKTQAQNAEYFESDVIKANIERQMIIDSLTFQPNGIAAAHKCTYIYIG